MTVMPLACPSLRLWGRFDGMRHTLCCQMVGSKPMVSAGIGHIARTSASFSASNAATVSISLQTTQVQTKTH